MIEKIVNEAAPEAPIPEPMLPMLWRVHLWRRNPARLPLLIAAILLAAIMVLLVFRSGWLALATVVLLIGSTSEYLFPISYQITAEGVFANVLLNRLALKWSEMRRIVSDSESVLLTPLEFASRRDGFRGVVLRFAEAGKTGSRAEVMAQIAHYVPQLIAVKADEEPCDVGNGLGRTAE